MIAYYTFMRRVTAHFWSYIWNVLCVSDAEKDLFFEILY